LKIAKVKIATPVLAGFFMQIEGWCFGVTKGVPADAKLENFKYSQQDSVFIATFSSSEFKDINNGDKVPFIEVEYMAYQLVPKADEPEAPKEAADAVH
jgi:hypothetical protein